MRGLAIALATLACATLHAQTPQFKSGVDVVQVNVSVRTGNRPVGNLGADDFTLTDNGVRQQVVAVSVEAVPIDVTLILDTSGSTAGAAERLRADAQQIAGTMRPLDRFRLLTIDTYIGQPVPMTAAGDRPAATVVRANGVSSVYDAIASALMRREQSDRRHLIVAITDAFDTISAVSAVRVREIAARSDALLHIVKVTQTLSRAGAYVRPYVGLYRDAETRSLVEAAERTGGELHDRKVLLGDPSAVGTFRRVYEEFRQSYVLRYTPAGVDPGGWHELGVSVPKFPRYDVHARKGYFAGAR